MGISSTEHYVIPVVMEYIIFRSYIKFYFCTQFCIQK